MRERPYGDRIIDQPPPLPRPPTLSFPSLKSLSFSFPSLKSLSFSFPSLKSLSFPATA
jgi:hypothetical protein